MKLLIAGGHLTPALCLIEKLPKSVSVLYCGRKYALEGDKAYSLEYQTIKKRNIPFAQITTGRLQRHLTKHTFKSLGKIPYGLYKAFEIVRKFKPDVVLGFGGYVSVPLCIAARILHIPVVIHEQTLDAGLANRMISYFAKKICVSYESSLDFFPREKTVLTGNPAVSEAFSFDKKSRAKTSPTLAIIGGSLGSHAINMLVKGSLRNLLEDYNIFHQTGDAKEFSDYETLSQEKLSLPTALQKKYTLVKFIDPGEIVKILYGADLVVSRAGINTITTLLILNKPSLIIPLTLSGNSEQKTNALFFKEHNLGEIAYQKDLTPQKFFTLTRAMMENRSVYTNSERPEELLAHKDAARNIIDILYYAQKTNTQKKDQTNP